MNAQSKVEPASLVAVLATVLPTLGAVHKNKKNPAFKSNYADLSAVLTAVAPISEHGLWFRQVPVQIDGGIGIETIYVHESGEELSAGVTPVPVNKNDAQGLGSALSYGRRYGLLTAFGLSAEDDDGNAAARGTRQESTVSPPQPPIEYAFPAGPAKNITQLKEMVRPLWREIKGCGDESELDGLLCVEANKAIIQQLINLENPTHRRELWEGDGKDNPGISGLIDQVRAECKVNLINAG